MPLNRLLVIVPFLMLFVISIAPALGQDQEITDLLREGYISYTQGNYEDALTAFEKANQIDPMNDTAWVGMGIALHNLNRSDEKVRRCR